MSSSLIFSPHPLLNLLVLVFVFFFSYYCYIIATFSWCSHALLFAVVTSCKTRLMDLKSFSQLLSA